MHVLWRSCGNHLCDAAELLRRHDGRECVFDAHNFALVPCPLSPHQRACVYLIEQQSDDNILEPTLALGRRNPIGV